MFLEIFYCITVFMSVILGFFNYYDRAIWVLLIGFNSLWYVNVYLRDKESKENNDGRC